MPLHLKSIHVSNLGPLAKFEMEFGLVNLIFGPNESGKTHLVEFIIQSIFQTKKIWNLRELKGQGIVKVINKSGNELDFSLSKKPKLDDILVGMQAGISNPLSRLLVVKGAELDLSDQDPAGVSYDFIGKVLSSSRLCHIIQEKLSDSMKKGQIEGKSITGPNNSEFKKRQNIKQDLDNLEHLLDEVNRNYSSGELAELRNQVQEAQSRFDGVNAARKFHAYILAQRKVLLQRELLILNLNTVTDLTEKFRELSRRIEDIDEQRARANEAASHCEKYTWLDEAVQIYEKLLLLIPKKPGVWILLLSVISFILGLVFIFFRLQIPTALSFSVALMLTGYYIYRLHKSLEKRNASVELIRLAQNYNELIGKPLRDVAQLRAQRDEQKRNYDLSDELNKLSNTRAEALKEQEVEIAVLLQRLTGFPVEKQDWGDIINKLISRAREQEHELRDIDLELAGLSLEPSEYLAEDPGEIYDKSKYRLYSRELNDRREKYSAKESELQILKQRACATTCQDISVTWETVLQSLLGKFQDRTDEYRTLSAELIAGILLNQELEQLIADEHQQIVAGLKDNTVREPLFKLTGHFQDIELDGNELIVSDGYNRIRLPDLSTGAREQVLLALRMGFAARILDHDCAFMILDDAFQHSDWSRREKMIDHVSQLAQSGWQLIYFSMDNHIRDLFRSQFADQFGKDFIYRSL